MSRNINANYGRCAKPSEPLGTGKAFYVIPSTGANVGELTSYFKTDEDGIVRAYTDIATAISACLTQHGDVVRLTPGTYTLTAGLTIAADGVTLEGYGAPGSCIIATSGTVDLLTCTNDNLILRNLEFRGAATKSSIVLTGVDQFLIEDCNIDHTGVAGAGTNGIKMVTTANTKGRIRRCRLSANLDVSGGSATMDALIAGLGNRITIEDCQLDARRQTTANAGAVTDGILFAAAADWGNVVQRCTFVEHNGATFTAGLEYGTNVLTGGVFPCFNNFLLATAANAIVNGSNSAGFGNNIANGTV